MYAQHYAYRCAVCAFTAYPKPEWDESPQPAYCPACGLPLERLACPSCAAPLLTVRGREWDHQLDVGRFCGYCGEPAVRHEPQMRVNPLPRACRKNT